MAESNIALFYPILLANASPLPREEIITDVTNRGGGADLNAQNVNVGEDIVGRDQIVQTTINNYVASIGPSRNDLEPTTKITDLEVETRGEVKPISDLIDRKVCGRGAVYSSRRFVRSGVLAEKYRRDHSCEASSGSNCHS